MKSLRRIAGNVAGASEYEVHNVPRASVYRNAGLVPANATNTIITWDVIDYDSEGMVNLTTFPTRLTARTSGLYRITGWGTWAPNIAGPRHMVFNRTTAAGVVTQFPSSGQLGNGADMQAVLAGYQTSQGPFAFDVVLNVGDYMELQVAQTSGGALAWLASTAALRNNGYQALLISTI